MIGQCIRLAVAARRFRPARTLKMIAKLAPGHRRAAPFGSAVAAAASRAATQVGDADGAVLVGDLLDHQPGQAGALTLGGDVGLEGAPGHFICRLGKPPPLIDHHQPARTVALLGARRASVLRHGRQPSKRGHVLGAFRQVVDHLAQLRAVADDARQVGARLGVQPPASCRDIQAEHLDQRVEVEAPSSAGQRQRA